MTSIICTENKNKSGQNIYQKIIIKSDNKYNVNFLSKPDIFYFLLKAYINLFYYTFY